MDVILMITKDSIQDNQPKSFQMAPGVWMVPCKIDDVHKKFVPVLRPFKNGQGPINGAMRHGWSMEEDEALAEIVSQIGAKRWSSISVQLNIRVHNGLPIRRGKQCRERWTGCLSPEIVRRPWTEEEDQILVEKQREFGNKWCIIIKELPGRTENQIKNRWRQIGKNLGVSVQELEPQQIFQPDYFYWTGIYY